jgi:hypothetical protein
MLHIGCIFRFVMILACVITQAGYNAAFENGNLIPKKNGKISS